MDLDVWLGRIKQTRSHAEVFAILDDFRTHEWTDEQCSKMGKLYIRMLDIFGPINKDGSPVEVEKPSSSDKKKEPKETKAAKEARITDAAAASAAATLAAEEIAPVTTGSTPVNDGPVWYEKM